jgi:hypothetical protein
MHTHSYDYVVGDIYRRIMSEVGPVKNVRPYVKNN